MPVVFIISKWFVPDDVHQLYLYYPTPPTRSCINMASPCRRRKSSRKEQKMLYHGDLNSLKFSDSLTPEPLQHLLFQLKQNSFLQGETFRNKIRAKTSGEPLLRRDPTNLRGLRSVDSRFACNGNWNVIILFLVWTLGKKYSELKRLYCGTFYPPQWWFYLCCIVHFSSWDSTILKSQAFIHFLHHLTGGLKKKSTVKPPSLKLFIEISHFNLTFPPKKNQLAPFKKKDDYSEFCQFLLATYECFQK